MRKTGFKQLESRFKKENKYLVDASKEYRKASNLLRVDRSAGKAHARVVHKLLLDLKVNPSPQKLAVIEAKMKEGRALRMPQKLEAAQRRQLLAGVRDDTGFELRALHWFQAFIRQRPITSVERRPPSEWRRSSIPGALWSQISHLILENSDWDSIQVRYAFGTIVVNDHLFREWCYTDGTLKEFAEYQKMAAAEAETRRQGKKAASTTTESGVHQEVSNLVN